MKSKLGFQLLDYLSFHGVKPSVDNSLLSGSEEDWQRWLELIDAAALTLHLLARLKERNDFERLPISIRHRMEQTLHDNRVRLSQISEEFLKFNRLLQSEGISYLNLKGLLLYPDFVDCLEHRVQYDHDFLVAKKDLHRALQIFTDLGYTPLEPSGRMVIDHLPTLVKKTDWTWKGNLYDSDIPRAIELHFRLWSPDFDLISISSLDWIWEESAQNDFQGFSVPSLSREHSLLYLLLHSFRHLLRSDLRLSHLYELSYFLHRFSQDRGFWDNFLLAASGCPQTLKAAALMFGLARHCFGGTLAPSLQTMIDGHLSPACDLWIRRYGRGEAIHCYRRSKNAIFLHLDFVKSYASRWILIWRKLIPRHLPLASYGVQTPPQRQNLRFRLRQRFYYFQQLLERLTFHLSSLVELSIQFPIWHFRLQMHKKTSMMKTKFPFHKAREIS